jgi:hypothetical protein
VWHVENIHALSVPMFYVKSLWDVTPCRLPDIYRRFESSTILHNVSVYLPADTSKYSRKHGPSTLFEVFKSCRFILPLNTRRAIKRFWSFPKIRLKYTNYVTVVHLMCAYLCNFLIKKCAFKTIFPEVSYSNITAKLQRVYWHFYLLKYFQNGILHICISRYKSRVAGRT